MHDYLVVSFNVRKSLFCFYKWFQELEANLLLPLKKKQNKTLQFFTKKIFKYNKVVPQNWRSLQISDYRFFFSSENV